MAAPPHSPSYAHGYHPTQHLPPSPPPSPPATRRRHRKKPDPFDALATTPIPSIPSSPTNEPDDAKEPLLIRIILTPILFTSFLVSLFLVNYRNRARRREAHSPSSTSLLTYLFPSTWLDPEPYQDPGDSTWDRRGTARHVEPHDAISPRREAQGEEKKPGKKRKSSWHLHKKIRKVAKLEIGDALEMRGRVIVGMAAVMVLTCAALCMGLKWCFMSISHALSGAKA